MSNYRSNDGLDASNTTDAYGDNNTGGRDTYRSNDGLDSSGTSDAYNQTSSGGGNYRSNDGLDASGTSDAYGDSGSGNSGGRANRTTDGLDPSGTSDAYGDSGTMYGRRTDSEAQEKTPGGTSYLSVPTSSIKSNTIHRQSRRTRLRLKWPTRRRPGNLRTYIWRPWCRRHIRRRSRYRWCRYWV